MTAAAALGFLFLAGASLAIGSFLAVLVDRLPRGASLWGRSHCPHCDAVLAPRDLVPVASFLVLRGRCRRCGGRISPIYPAIELAALGLGIWAWSVSDGPTLAASCVFGWTLFALALIDCTHFVLPDLLTLPLLAAGLCAAALFTPDALLDNVLGAVAGFAIFTAIAWLYRRLRGRDGLGVGDANLLAAIGAWVGASGLPSVVFGAAVAGLAGALALRALAPSLLPGERVPFGPALALAGWLVWLYGPWLGWA